MPNQNKIHEKNEWLFEHQSKKQINRDKRWWGSNLNSATFTSGDKTKVRVSPDVNNVEDQSDNINPDVDNADDPSD